MQHAFIFSVEARGLCERVLHVLELVEELLYHKEENIVSVVALPAPDPSILGIHADAAYGVECSNLALQLLLLADYAVVLFAQSGELIPEICAYHYRKHMEYCSNGKLLQLKAQTRQSSILCVALLLYPETFCRVRVKSGSARGCARNPSASVWAMSVCENRASGASDAFCRGSEGVSASAAGRAKARAPSAGAPLPISARVRGS